MAGTQSRYAWQFKQRLTSAGLNTQTDYLARNTSEVGRHLVKTDKEVAHQSGIFSGFIATVVPGTLRTAISPGLGQLFDSGLSEPDSQAEWLELRASIEVSHAPGDAIRPRWDVIEVQPAAVDATAEIIDFFNPADNTFTPAVVAVQKTSQAVAQVRAGTPDANPKLPAGTPGWIPIAYVYVEANALALNPNRVMYCRPILHARRGVTPDNITGVLAPFNENYGISGGGWNVAADGLAGTLASTMNGVFPEHGGAFHIPRGVQVDISTQNIVGGVLPVVNVPVYAYVAPPPYPAGYDLSMAPRELYIADSLTTPGLASTISVGSRGCIVITDTGAPGAGPLGQAGGNNATYTITNNFWGTVNIVRSQMLFIGAAFFATAIPGLTIQRCNGAWVTTKRKTGVDVLALVPIGAPVTINLWTSIAADPVMTLPSTARRVSVAGNFQLLPTGTFFLSLEDQWTGDGGRGVVTFEAVNFTADPNVLGGTHEMMVNEDGECIANKGVATNAGGDGCNLYVRAYEDAVLCQR